MRNILISASYLLVSCLWGCVEEKCLPAPVDAATLADAENSTPPSDDLGTSVADGAVCDGDACAPFCVFAPEVGPAPTFACDAAHEGDVLCGDTGCGHLCMGSCWILQCDACGELDAGT
jgi:hypothetical protein